MQQPAGSTLMEEIIFLPEEVEKTLVSSDRRKAAGPDEIHPALLGPLGSILAAPLARLFNLSMATATLPTATLPQDWKVATVAPIHKGGDRELATNYRPVSLLSVVLKVMERPIRDKMARYLTQYDLLAKPQHGFRQGRSCLTIRFRSHPTQMAQLRGTC
ncbi:unnamed protein product [Echinostoma caproni]|uniref:Reverse transcriptase domain-containing protein n=1 Tax=Echinostoma caproni TaxID=27848 RepID=A0A183BC37_9TREM|nr:unnamed protein product [Echinostoma caproni]